MLPVLRVASHGKAGRRARGGAMVEFVLLNIILIPLFLYAIFLMDAAYLKLDLQETVVSGIWDFSQRNSEPPGWSGVGNLAAPNTHDQNNQMEVQAAERAVRVAYADHTSAFDDGAEPNQGTDVYGVPSYLSGDGDGSDAPSLSGHMKHHTGFGAQYSFRWRSGPDTQFLCSLSGDTGWNPEPNFSSFASSGYTAGGEVRCEATGFIYNYIIPETFLQEFSQVEMTKMKQRKDTTAEGAHEWQGEGGNVNNIVAYETASISFNTWALRNGAKNQDNYNPGSYTGALSSADLRAPQSGIPMPQGAGSPEANPFYRRVQFLYTMNGTAGATYGRVVSAASSLMSKANSEKIMLVQNLPPGTVTNNLMPNIIGVHLTARYRPGSPGEPQRSPGFFGGGSFLSTPYTGPNNDYQTAARARGPYYLGCRNPENPSCF